MFKTNFHFVRCRLDSGESRSNALYSRPWNRAKTTVAKANADSSRRRQVHFQNEIAGEVKDKTMARPGSSEAKFVFAVTVNF